MPERECRAVEGSRGGEDRDRISPIAAHRVVAIADVVTAIGLCRCGAPTAVPPNNCVQAAFFRMWAPVPVRNI